MALKDSILVPVGFNLNITLPTADYHIYVMGFLFVALIKYLLGSSFIATSNIDQQGICRRTLTGL